jgi:lipopolysaccharide transport system permease protein
VDFLVASAILAGLMVWYHFPPTWRLLALPGLVVMATVAAFGPGLIVTALTVRFRDFRMIIPFVVQFGLYACPVAYSSKVVHDKLILHLGQELGGKCFLLYSINPMVGVIDGFRWAILGGPQPFDGVGFIASMALAVGLLYIGIVYFRKAERAFADTI